MTCNRCNATMDELDAFPGGICLECHAKTWQPGTAEELADMFRNSVNVGRRKRILNRIRQVPPISPYKP